VALVSRPILLGLHVDLCVCEFLWHWPNHDQVLIWLDFGGDSCDHGCFVWKGSDGLCARDRGTPICFLMRKMLSAILVPNGLEVRIRSIHTRILPYG
jgi:hypothetical protein